jgi:phosphoglucosamine mutase
MKKLFGTDGVRGVANTSPMDSETVMRLGRAAAYVLRKSKGRHQILIGKDTRISGYMLETALASGITSMGVDVLLVGPLPTPGVAYLTKSMRADAGVMISASHNSYEDNGIKFFAGDGFKLADDVECEIEKLIQPGHLDELRAVPELVGKAYRIDDAVGRYTVYLKSCVSRDVKLDNLKIVVDTANGAAYKIAPLVFSELGANVITTADEPDGKNINQNCGSLFPERISTLVREYGADCGIAFDGDADRVVMCDENGEVIDGDFILAEIALAAQRNGTLKGGGVVGTIMSNMGLEKKFQETGLSFSRTAVGDRYVLAEMLKKGMNFGGEQSGHVISLDHNTTGDGILTSLLVIASVLEGNRKFSDVSKNFKRYPQILVNIPVKEKIPFEDNKNITEALEFVTKKLGDSGRVSLRYSGTESKIRVMVECSNQIQCQECVDSLSAVVRKELC